MEQLTQNLKDGTMELLEVPFPALPTGYILVRNHYSVISPGTEGKTVKDARLGYIAKARARKNEVKKVLQTAKVLGIRKTWTMVMNKLDSPSPLGYSCAGEVIAVASGVREIKPGDRVACGGPGAVHAEVVAVHENLCVKMDPSVDLKQAAFTTIGAIAMQGIRQSGLKLGENCVVIGLGLLGQLTVQLLRAAGVRTAGIDLDPFLVSQALQSGCELSLTRDEESLEQRILDFTNGYGTDAVIITAGTDSTDPVDLAGTLARKKGSVIVVGAVPTGFRRAPYYRKELELKMSTSYGPGRYDPEYEEQGLDYPYAYVRWTENRNMQAFASLLASGSLNTGSLVSHVFPFQEAPAAYQMILDRKENFSGVVLQYDPGRVLKQSVLLAETKHQPSSPAVALIGAGSFGQNFLLPALKGRAEMVAVITARPHNARNIADKYGFARCPGTTEEIFNDPVINTVFIATRHDTHADFVMQALKAGKNVFTEKPLCLTEDELREINRVWEVSGKRLMVGFNRRFAPFTKKIKETFGDAGPVAIQYRINAGQVPPEHWIHQPSVGGGRITGEVCHFVDLCMYLAGSPLTAVNARMMQDSTGLKDTLNILLGFANGSTAALSYFSNGNKQVAKERLEVFSSGRVALLDDFNILTLWGRSKKTYKGKMDKGHDREVEVFLGSVKSGSPSPIPEKEIFLSTLATFKILESISQNGTTIQLESF
ncbi:MAG: bi-domain-containing oxidoreductase [Bacteroidia bacterium]|nr:bi-domain-containing oxidoreductase [Bacteroidia bacterium]